MRRGLIGFELVTTTHPLVVPTVGSHVEFFMEFLGLTSKGVVPHSSGTDIDHVLAAAGKKNLRGELKIACYCISISA